MTDIASIVRRIFTDPHVATLSPCESPWIFYQPWSWIDSSQNHSMIWASNFTICVNSRTVVHPAFRVDSNRKRLIFESLNNNTTVIRKLYITLNSVLNRIWRNSTTSKISPVGVIRFKQYTKIPYVFVGIGIPPAHTAVIIIGSRAINNLLFGQIESHVFTDHVCALDGTNGSERVTCTTSLLELYWSHFPGSLPVHSYCRSLQPSEIWFWWNHLNLLALN